MFDMKYEFARSWFFAAAMLACLVAAPQAQAADEASDPATLAIPFGKFAPVPDAENRPDPSKTYKALIELTVEGETADKPNPGLLKIARLVNIFVAEGVPLDHLTFVVSVHGPATPIVLDDEAYREKFGVPNPNLPVIEALTEAGVPVHVCGQALARFEFERESVDDRVKVDLSSFVTIVLLGNEGYAHLTL